MAASHFLEVQVKSQVISLQVQVKSQDIWSDVKSSRVKSHLVQTQVKSQVSLSKYKSSRTLFCPAVGLISNQGQASNQSTVSYSQRYMKWSMVLNNFYWCTNMAYHTCIHNEILLYLLLRINDFKCNLHLLRSKNIVNMNISALESCDF